MSTKLLAFHGDAKIKKTYLDRVRAHRKADDIQHGYYWEKGKGCAVGCTIHSPQHDRYETELGIPRQLAHLEDRIFESMQNGEAQKWPEQFLSAPRVGADLSLVWPRFALWLLADKRGPVFKAAQRRSDVAKAVDDVAALYREWVNTGTTPNDARWREVRAYAYAAASASASAASAAYAASYDAAAAYAAAAADAAYAAADAAYAAADARSRARAKFWLSARGQLLKLLKAAPVSP